MLKKEQETEMMTRFNSSCQTEKKQKRNEMMMHLIGFTQWTIYMNYIHDAWFCCYNLQKHSNSPDCMADQCLWCSKRYYMLMQNVMTKKRKERNRKDD